MRTKRAAEVLGVTRRRVERMAADGELPSTSDELGRIYAAAEVHRVAGRRASRRTDVAHRRERKAGARASRAFDKIIAGPPSAPARFTGGTARELRAWCEQHPESRSRGRRV